METYTNITFFSEQLHACNIYMQVVIWSLSTKIYTLSTLCFKQIIQLNLKNTALGVNFSY